MGISQEILCGDIGAYRVRSHDPNGKKRVCNLDYVNQRAGNWFAFKHLSLLLACAGLCVMILSVCDGS